MYFFGTFFYRCVLKIERNKLNILSDKILVSDLIFPDEEYYNMMNLLQLTASSAPLLFLNALQRNLDIQLAVPYLIRVLRTGCPQKMCAEDVEEKPMHDKSFGKPMVLHDLAQMAACVNITSSTELSETESVCSVDDFDEMYKTIFDDIVGDKYMGEIVQNTTFIRAGLCESITAIL